MEPSTLTGELEHRASTFYGDFCDDEIFFPALLFVACGPQPPIEEGFDWELNTEYSSVTQSFWLRASGEPIESVGPLETASSCLLARTSAGTFYSRKKTGTRTELSRVIGVTEMYHPLVPNSQITQPVWPLLFSTASAMQAMPTTPL